jgi:hypothetical protein
MTVMASLRIARLAAASTPGNAVRTARAAKDARFREVEGILTTKKPVSLERIQRGARFTRRLHGRREAQWAFKQAEYRLERAVLFFLQQIILMFI